MKKTYNMPQIRVAQLHTEHMLAASIPVNHDKEVNGSDAYSNHRGWSCTHWMKEEEE